MKLKLFVIYTWVNSEAFPHVIIYKIASAYIEYRFYIQSSISLESILKVFMLKVLTSDRTVLLLVPTGLPIPYASRDEGGCDVCGDDYDSNYY